MGLFALEENVFEGYTLLSPNSKSVYLINNCGHWVHKWETNYVPGAVTYLLEDGRLLRTCRIAGQFNGGGTGGRLEIFDWDSNLLWGHTFSQDTTYHQHHDVEYLPNGNILVVEWERLTQSEAIAIGRQATAATPNGLWLEQIREIKPVGTDEIEVVWEWHLKDHVVQENNPNVANFGSVFDHPEKLHINHFPNGASMTASDVVHINSIDYSPSLDQIVVSTRAYSEIWVIDHSTTTSEAATSTGGNSGKGGDFLYRYGNPQTYRRGFEQDQTFYGQHNAYFIEGETSLKGGIMVYNNGDGRPSNLNYSTVDVIVPPIQPDGSYAIEVGKAYGPEIKEFVFGEDPSFVQFYSPRTSSAEQLPNNNILICEGGNGRVIEIDLDGNLVWEYQNPVGSISITTQGFTPNNAGMFRAMKYGYDYPAFMGKDLTPVGPIELEPIWNACTISEVVDIDTQALKYNSIVENTLNISVDNKETLVFSIRNMNGQLVKQGTFAIKINQDLSGLQSGMYILSIQYPQNTNPKNYKFIKQ